MRLHGKQLNKIRLDARPEGLQFRSPDSARARYDATLTPRAAAKEETQIDVLGDVGANPWTGEGVTAAMVKEKLATANGGPVRVNLNSPGGDAFEGVAIFNLLREHKGRVTVDVLGLAASAASVIAMAGDKVIMGEGAMMMIHSAWGFVMGNADDMTSFADLLNQIDRSAARLYANRTGMDVDDVMAMMKAETWMSGDEAVAKGFADVAVGSQKPKARMPVTVLASKHTARPQVVIGHAASGALPVASARMSATSPGAAGTSTNRKGNTMNLREQIAALENTRAARAARMTEIMQEAAKEGRTTTEAEGQEVDDVTAEIEQIDRDLVRLRAAERLSMQAAAPVQPAAGDDPAAAATTRGAPARLAFGSGVRVRANIEPGVRMSRFAMGLYLARGNAQSALAICRSNQRWMDQTPELERVFQAAVAAGDTTTSGWASELVYAENIQAEFIQYLRPMTVLGRLTGFRQVPFNVRVPSQTAGGTGYWVGQGAAVPVSKMTTSSTSLGIAKCAGLMAIDDELARSSSPSAELLVRNDLAEVLRTLLDVAVIDPNQGGQTNIQPAAWTYGVTPVTPSGTNYAAFVTDVKSLLSSMISANQNVAGGYWVMSTTTALALSLMVTSLGNPQFPGLTMAGGEIMGRPVVVSQSAYISGSPDYANMIVFVIPEDILLADDGQIAIGISNEASIQLLDNPTNASTSGTTATTMVSMFQTNSLAIKAVRYINWVKARSTAAAFIRTSAYA